MLDHLMNNSVLILISFRSDKFLLFLCMAKTITNYYSIRMNFKKSNPIANKSNPIAFCVVFYTTKKRETK